MMDFHVHLDLFDDPHKLVEKVRRAGIYTLSVTTTPSAFCGTRQLARHCPRIRTGLGLHPEVAADRIGELGLFDRLIEETAYIGEIGLDGSRHHRSTLSVQRKAFRHILRRCASDGGRILSIHSRGAATQVLDHLEEHCGGSTPILHWFSGTMAELERASRLGAWFSIGPAMVVSDRQRKKIAEMPKERVLLESDGPFTTFKNRPLSPLLTYQAIPFLAHIWNTDEDAAHAQLATNLRHIGAKAVVH